MTLAASSSSAAAAAAMSNPVGNSYLKLRTAYQRTRRLLPGVSGTKHQDLELPTNDAERLAWCNDLRKRYGVTAASNTLGMCECK